VQFSASDNSIQYNLQPSFSKNIAVLSRMRSGNYLLSVFNLRPNFTTTDVLMVFSLQYTTITTNTFGLCLLQVMPAAKSINF